MNIVFKKSQQALNSIQRKIRWKLQQIQLLDKQCLQIQYNLETMKSQYLQSLSQNYLKQQHQYSPNDNIRLQDIAKLEDELKQLTLKKIQITQDIQNMVKQTTQNIQKQICQTAQQLTGRTHLKQQIKNQHLFQSGLKKQKGRQKNVNPEIKAIIKQYYNEKQSQNTVYQPQNVKYCVCSQKTKLKNSQNMIECQNPNCKVGWHHFECVGITQDYIPNHWFCQKCIEKEFKNVKNVNIELEDRKMEIEVSKLPNNQDSGTQLKRKRGRPKKFTDYE